MAKKKKPTRKQAAKQATKQTAKKQATPKKQKAGTFPDFFLNEKIMALVIFLLSILPYLNTINHDFAQDDGIVLSENVYTQDGVGGISGILGYDTFYGFFQEAGKDNLVAGGRYRPFTLIMFAIGHEIYGNNPTPYHIMNLIWYGLTVVLLYLVLLNLFKQRFNRGMSYFVAFAAAVIFAIHPLHTEVVANIKGRDEIMALFFGLAAMMCSFKAIKDSKMLFHILAGVLLFCGLMSKENAVVFLGALPIALWIFHQKEIKEIGMASIPYLVAFIVFYAIRASVLGDAASLTSTPSRELMNNPYLKIVNGQYVDFTMGEKLATIMHTLWKYIELLIFPHTLTHDYYPRHIDLMTWGKPTVSGSFLLHLGILGAGSWGLVKKKPFAFGILFYLGALFLVSNILFAVGTHMAERFMFMPSAGFCLLVALGLYHLCKYLNKKMPVTDFKQLYPALGIIGLILVLGCYKTVNRNFDWKDNFSLFKADVTKSVNSAKIQNSMAGEYTVQSQKSGVKDTPLETEYLDKAAVHIDNAINLHPNYKLARFIKGNILFYKIDYPAAVNQYREVINLDDGYKDAKNNLGLALAELAPVRVREGNAAAAEQHLREALSLKPEEMRIQFYMDVLMSLTGRGDQGNVYYNKGMQLYQQKLQTDGKDIADAFLVFALEETGKFAGTSGGAALAIKYFGEAVKRYPENPKTQFFLGSTYAQTGNFQKAIEHLLQAEKHNQDPANFQRVYLALASTYQQLGNTAKAQEYTAKAQGN